MSRSCTNDIIHENFYHLFQYTVAAGYTKTVIGHCKGILGFSQELGTGVCWSCLYVVTKYPSFKKNRKRNVLITGIVYLTGELPKVTMRYKQKRTFFNPKFDQICPKIATFFPFFNPKYPKNVFPC